MGHRHRHMGRQRWRVMRGLRLGGGKVKTASMKQGVAASSKEPNPKLFPSLLSYLPRLPVVCP